jgi:hypothetical protein
MLFLLVYSIDVVMAGVLSSSTADRSLEPHTVLTRDYNNGIRVMVLNDTFNNISVISWRSVILVEETGGSSTDILT